MAGQRITFGMHLDGQRTTTPTNSIGVSVVGPLGLMNILETQLGLLALHPSQAERIVQYRACLEKHDNDARFYHRSFATDPQGTAAHLLDWRDQWLLHGWRGAMPEGVSRRLRDMAEVEADAASQVSPAIGQRLLAIHRALQHRRPDIEEIRLVEPTQSMPVLWQKVFAELPVVEHGALPAAGRGFLGEVQQQLERAVSGQQIEKRPWRDDGTVLIVQAETQALAAQWLATQLEDRCPTLLVSEASGPRLDAQVSAAGLPRQGLREASTFRPALQVLPLALELLWAPLDFEALVQFLTHPVCPLPIIARRLLAEKVAEAPGIGGRKWQSALDKIAKHYAETDETKAQDVLEQVALWIEHRRFPSDEGAPLDAVIARVEQVSAFFRKRLGETDAAKRLAFLAGHAQCVACLDSLRRLQGQGAALIRPRQLQKFVAQATGDGSVNVLWPAEVGAVQAVNHPGAAIEPIERVIWSPLGMPVLPAGDPWSASEVQSLLANGVALPSLSVRLERLAATWLRPVMAARGQLVLVLPPPGAEVHPLWQMVKALIDGQPKVLPLERLLETGGEYLNTIEQRRLPAPKRWWKLPDDVSVAPRAKESFSSLEKFLFNPYQWLLQYPAELRPSRVVSLSNDFRLRGNLAHALVEQFFLTLDALTMSEAAFDEWFALSFERLIDHEGAVLRMPGRGADLEGFRHRLQRSMRTLRDQVSKAGVTKVTPEQRFAGRFPGGDLTGSADLVMQKKPGELVIVDMKWSGANKYRERLQSNAHLQLAIYAELLRQDTGCWPSVAYYILDQARLFAPDEGSFPDAEVVTSSSGENTGQIWMRFLETYHWRVEQAHSRQFELVLEGVTEAEESKSPENAMKIEVLNTAYNDYLTLAGWGEQA